MVVHPTLYIRKMGAPNFVYKKNGLVITWYKHANRGVTSNMEYPGAKNWAKAVMTCIESIK